MRHAFIDKFSHLASPIHALDPRVKLLATLAFILCVFLTPPARIAQLPLLGALILLLALCSRLPLLFLLRRSGELWIFFLLVAVFLPLRPGTPWLKLALGPWRGALTYEGLQLLIFFSLRAWLSLFAVVLLSQTTSFAQILKSLEYFRLPRLLILLMSFLYRYLFVLVDEGQRLERARLARSFKESNWKKIKGFSALIATLFVRTYERGERVYLAMLARGYAGETHLFIPMKMRTADWSAAALFLALIILLRWGVII